ncbi:MAG TPA: PAS domain S-box protein [Bryobacteraceae bacterium]|nr:PAS domain S-box protein [Bryobacteraceae bacterium]
MTPEGLAHPANGLEKGGREILDVLPIAVIITDANGLLTYFNPAAERLVGRSPVLGVDRWCITWKLFLPDGRPLPHDQCPLAAVLRGENIVEGAAFLAERPDHSRFWVVPYPALLRNVDGKVTGVLNMLVDMTALKVAQTKAEHDSLLLSAIVDSSDDAIISKDLNGVITSWNKSAERLFGYTSGEIVGKPITILIPPERLDEEPYILARLRRGERVEHFETVRLRKDGKLIDTSVSISPVRDPWGHIIGASKIVRDITDSKRTERSARLLGAIVDSSDDAIISKDLNGIITSWNKSAERIFGYTADEIVGKPVTMLVPPDRLDEELEIQARIRQGERVDHIETVRRSKDGKLLDVSLTISPVRGARGEIMGGSKIARDISDRRNTERSVRLLHSIVDSSDDAIISKDLNGIITSWNESAERLFGYRAEEIVGKPITILIPPDRLEEELTILARLRNGERVDHFETIRQCKDGSLLDISLTISPIRDERGRVIGASKVARDITERKRADAELRRAHADLEQFAYSASHDLQEPLRSIKVYSELLTRRYSDKLDGEALEYLIYLRSGAARMESMITDLLTYNQVGRTEEPETTDANVVLGDVLDNLANLIAESHSEITADPLPMVRMHHAHLQQLLQNLIGNAIKYRRPERPPAVHVAGSRGDSECVFSVSDNGIGIAPEYKEKVFGLFKRLHTEKEYAGTGIGLAICKRIVDQYSGRIWVESELGKGCTFHFTIPEPRGVGA